MSRIENSLLHIETRLRELVEGVSREPGIPRKLRRQLMRALVTALRSGVLSHPDVKSPARLIFIAPNKYTLIMPVEDAQSLLSNPALLDRLVAELETSAKKANIIFTEPPILQVVADPSAKGVKILVEFSSPEKGKPLTSQMETEQSGSGLLNVGKNPEAFLIVNGLTTFLLNKPVINIGTSPENQVVLTDPGISSTHAQLRANNSHFVVFDLGSKSGTFVNGILVSSQVLKPGDVIKVGGQLLVFGQESPPPSGYTQKLAAAPLPPEVI